MANISFLCLLLSLSIRFYSAASTSNLGRCVKTTDDLVFQTFQFENLTLKHYNFHIEQKRQTKTFFHKQCIQIHQTRVLKCRIQKPMEKWDLIIKGNDTILHNFYWDFNKRECNCPGITSVYKLKLGMMDSTLSNITYKVQCIFQTYSNMLSVDHNTVYLDLGNHSITLHEKCNPSKQYFFMNPFDQCVSGKICSTSKFLQCSNKGEPHCVPFHSFLQDDLVLKHLNCEVMDSEGLKVKWNFEGFPSVKHISFNFYRKNSRTGQKVSLLSKNISSTSGSFLSKIIDSELNNDEVTVDVDGCLQCQCFKAKKRCLGRTGIEPPPKKKTDDTSVIIDVLFGVAFGVILLCLGGFAYYCYKRRKIDNNTDIVGPRGNIKTEKKEATKNIDIETQNIYEEIPAVKSPYKSDVDRAFNHTIESPLKENGIYVLRSSVV